MPNPTDKPRVLIIVRDTAEQRLIYRLLSPHAEAHTSFSATLGVTMLHERPYDLIVTSTNLPRTYGGLGMLKAIRDVPGHDATPVVAVCDSDEDATTLREGGATACLLRPLSMDDTHAVLLQVLGLPSVVRPLRAA